MKEFIQNAILTVICLVCAYGLVFLSIDAAARESEWREDRLQKYYSEEINPSTAITPEECGC